MEGQLATLGRFEFVEVDSDFLWQRSLPQRCCPPSDVPRASTPSITPGLQWRILLRR
jgi:hypothetical protein